MKKWMTATLFMAVALGTQAQTNFYQGTWKEAFAEAQKQNKYLFIDCYTDWCGWCKVADEKTFPAKEVADVLNKDFISVQEDMERGDGVYLGMKYRVLGYPSYLIFAPDGSFAHRMSGYIADPKEFAAQVMSAKDTSARPAYPSKLMDVVEFPDFYAKSFTDKGLDAKRTNPAPGAVDAWLATQKDLMSEAVWSVMYKFPVGDKYEQHFLENRAAYAERYGQNEVRDKVAGMAYEMLQTAMQSQKESDLLTVIEFADRHMDENKEESKTVYRLKFCEGKRDWSGFVECVGKLIDFYGFENYLEGINNYCWTMYLNADNKDVLNTAITWMERVVKLEPLYMYLDTHAALLYKVGRYDEALTMALKAIETGKASGENVSDTEELRDQIMAAKQGN